VKINYFSVINGFIKTNFNTFTNNLKSYGYTDQSQTGLINWRYKLQITNMKIIIRRESMFKLRDM